MIRKKERKNMYLHTALHRDSIDWKNRNATVRFAPVLARGILLLANPCRLLNVAICVVWACVHANMQSRAIQSLIRQMNWNKNQKQNDGKNMTHKYTWWKKIVLKKYSSRSRSHAQAKRGFLSFWEKKTNC